MATQSRFIAKNGLDNNSNSITNLGTSGNSLTMTGGAHAVTLTTTGATNVTLPTSGTLATVSQLPTVNNGTLILAVSGTGLSGSASFTANQSGNSTFTVTSNATSANTASTIVARDASGNFSAGTITGSLTGAASLNVLKTGDTMTGNLTISKTLPDLTLNPSTTTDFARVIYSSAGSTRWIIGKNNIAETGSNAGSNFYIQRFTDAGADIDIPLTISRSTGLVTIGSLTVTGTLTGTLTGSATSATSATNATNAAITDDTTTNADEFITWSPNASGNNGLRVSSTKLTFNPSTGNLTSTLFTGSGAGLTSIPNAALVNSSVTVGTTAISLGSSSTTLAGLTSVTSTSFVGALTGNASTATTLATGRTIGMTGDVTWTSASFNGSANVTGTSTLATVNASPQTDTFRKITVNGKGLVTATSAVTASDITTALAYTPVNKAGDTMTGNLILNADPTSALGAATKQYVDNVAAGLNAHAACQTSTTATLASSTGGTITYNNGTGGVGATLTTTTSWGTIGGYAVALNDRVLVKNEASQINNGVYVVTSTTVLTRATDFDDSPDGEVVAGDFVYIQNGTLAGTQWVQTTVNPVIGTNNIVFTQLSGSGTVTGGTGIDVTSNVVSLATGNTLSLFNLATNGLVARTAANTVTARSLAVSGTGLSVSNADGVAGNPTITSNATNANTASTIVARDASGNFAAGTITASLTGAASLNVLKAGDTMTGFLTINAANASLIVNGGGAGTSANIYFASTGGNRWRFGRDTSTETGSNAGSNFFMNAIADDGSTTIGTALSITRSTMNATFAGTVTATGFVGPLTGNASTATTATNATNAAITDDTTTNANEFIVWSPNSSGNNGLRVSSTKLTFNPSTGNLSTTSITASSTISSVGNLYVGNGISTTDAAVEIGLNRTGDGPAYVDFWGAATPGDYNSRVIRAGGVNGGFTLTNRGTGNFAIQQEATGPIVFNLNGSERARFDSDGDLGIGTSNPTAKLEVVSTGLVLQTFGTQQNHRIFSNDTAPYYQVFLKSRGTQATPVSVNAGDAMGAIQFYGRDTANDRQAASIASFVEGTPANSTVAGNLIFSTTPTGVSQTPVERMRIDSSGRMLIGGTQATAGATNGSLEIQNTSGDQLFLTRYNASAAGPVGLYLNKSRGATVGTNTILQNGDSVGVVIFRGANGTDFTSGASIGGIIDGTPSAAANDMPTAITFGTAADNGAGISERMRVGANGVVYVNTTSQLSAGYTSQLNINGQLALGTATSTNGSILLTGQYNAGALTSIGTEFSTGAPVIGYAVTPSTAASGAFLSSYASSLPRSALTVADTMRFYTGAAQTPALGAAATLTEKMRLDNDGNLLLNTTTASSSAKLTIRNVPGNPGIVIDNGTSVERLHFYARNAAGISRIESQNSIMQLYTWDPTDMIFGTSNAERLRITSTGTITTAYPITSTNSITAASHVGPLIDANNYRIVNPTDAYYFNAASANTGAIKIQFPVGMTNSMMGMTIKCYEYTTNESFEIHCGGYMYNVGNTWANNPYAYIVGNPNIDRRFTVRFGYTAGGKAVIYIGELASSWSYLNFGVTEVRLGYSGVTSAFNSGWVLGFEATAFENVTATISNCQIGYQSTSNTANSVVLRDGSGNFSAGTITATLSGNASTATLAANTSSISSAVGGAYTWTNTQNFTSNGNVVGTATQLGYLQAYSTGGQTAGMSFHRSGAYAINMGLDSDNVFRIGGWSDGLNTYRLQVAAGGAVTATSFNATSTARVKDAITDLGKTYLDRFSKLKPREYDRTDYGNHEFGFVAEEMAEVYPEIVVTDNNGKPAGIDYSRLSTILTAKVQEQQSVIDKLQEQMAKVMELLKGSI